MEMKQSEKKKGFSIQKRIILFCTLVMGIAAIAMGAVTYFVVSKSQKHETEDAMEGIVNRQAYTINEKFIQVETSVEDITALTDNTIKSLTDVKDKTSRNELTAKIQSVFLAIMSRNTDVVACYITYDPDLIHETDGMFFTKDQSGKAVRNEITDISKYDPDDIEHVGWYTLPKRAKKPIWLEPYYNKNINQWLISYVVPFYKNGQLVAVIGMDLNFEKIVAEVNQFHFYENGYAFLKSSDGSMHYHPSFFQGENHGDEKDMDSDGQGKNTSVEGYEPEVFEYHYNGEKRVGAAVALRNGMQLFVCDSYKEIYHNARVALWNILIGIGIAFIVLVAVLVAFARKMVSPIMELTGVAREIEHQNYDIKIKKKRKDEIGELQNAITLMADALQKQKVANVSTLAERNRRLVEAVEEAKRASQAKSDFLSQMSHDIRTPMNAIVGMSNIAKDNIDNKEKVSDCLNKISTSSDYLLSLISDVLDMSRIESGTLAVQEHEFSLMGLVEKTLLMVDPQVKEHGHKIEADMSGIQHDTVIVDGLRMQQVLVNVVSNAIKYTNQGGKIDIRVLETETSSPSVSHFKFIVKDNGIGMTKEFQENIFKPFIREKDEHQTEVKGTGLGMAITKAIVDLMNGEITIDSELGKGTEVTVEMDLQTLDTVKVIREKVVAPVEEGKSTLSGLDLKGKNILVVDDMIINLEIATTLVESTGAHVDQAPNGKAAVEAFFEKPEGYYAAVLMDIRMPVMDGYDATRNIRAEGSEYAKQVPIIAMSANAFEEDKKQSKAAGMNEHITKPIDVNLLAETLEKYVLHM